MKKVGQNDKDREVGGAGLEERSGQKLAAYVESYFAFNLPQGKTLTYSQGLQPLAQSTCSVNSY